MFEPVIDRRPAARWLVLGSALLLPAIATSAAESATAEATPWVRHTIDASSIGADGVRVADADADGDLDVAVGWEGGSITRLYLNPGPGGVNSPWPRVECGPAKKVEDAVIVDVDGDGANDVVSSTEFRGEKIVVHFAPTETARFADSSAWQTEAFPTGVVPLSYWMYCEPADINGDGAVDLVVGSKQKAGQVAWLAAPTEGRRDLSRWRYNQLSSAGWVMSIVARDMDDDGDLDLLISDRKKYKPGQGVRWLENVGGEEAMSTPWPSHPIGLGRNEVMFLDVGDLDGDGVDEIAGLTKQHKIRWFKRPADPREPWQAHEVAWPTGVGTVGKSIQIADINLDGKADLVCTFSGAENASGLRWASFESSPTETAWRWHEVSGPEGIKFDRIEMIDLDQDGDLDLLTTEEVGRVTAEDPALGVVWYENPSLSSD